MQRRGQLATLYALSVVGAGLAAQESAKDPAALVNADAQLRAGWAEAWLHSDDPRQVAWGAWLARVDRRTALIPLLLQEVTDYSSGDNDRHDAMLQVLDALIQLHAAVPADQARKFYPEFAAQSLILLVRSPDDAQQPLLEIFDHAEANRTWLAAGNVLLKTMPATLAPRLLARFTQHLSVHVPDRGFGGGSGGGGSECGFSARAPKRGWPPVGLYQLDQFPQRYSWLTAAFLDDGATPVYYWRAEPGNYDNPSAARGYCSDGDRDEYRAQYLARLLQPAFRNIPIEAYPRTDIVWEGETSYRDQLGAVIEEKIAVFRHAVEALRQLRLLSPDAAASLAPRLEIAIIDERHDQSVPLPAAEARTGVEMVTGFRQPLP